MSKKNHRNLKEFKHKIAIMNKLRQQLWDHVLENIPEDCYETVTSAGPLKVKILNTLRKEVSTL